MDEVLVEATKVDLTKPLCGWQFERTVVVDDDDWGYEPYNFVDECPAIMHVTPRGWTCENGHSYVNMEARWREGWDYAHDEEEAKMLRGVGVNAVGMDGGSI